MKILKKQSFTGERALYFASDLCIEDSTFEDGESHLKESKNIKVSNCIFGWKYPLWNCQNVQVKNCVLKISARSGIWYTNNITISDSAIDAPKTFRKSSWITLKNVTMPNAEESLWSCRDIDIKNVTVNGDYFCMGSENIVADGLEILGNYAFDGGKNITIKNSRLISKDAFWNTENVVVENSTIIGEYLGWNSKNLTFRSCYIESDQGLCYIDSLTLTDCRIDNTPLAFEYCKNVNAEISGHLPSVKNPTSGTITADSFGEIIIDPRFTNPEDVKLITRKNDKDKK